MQTVLLSNDPVRLSWAQSVLAGHGIEAVILDFYTSVIEGSIGAIPRRLAVDESDAVVAIRLLEEAQAELDAGLLERNVD